MRMQEKKRNTVVSTFSLPFNVGIFNFQNTALFKEIIKNTAKFDMYYENWTVI